ncbi:MAG TPA: 4-alpha-glucanotransferase [Acidimicrobiales bacterium]|nr:4-alpha-glucanotransferase [Acidimicrobiales bacterium]
MGAGEWGVQERWQDAIRGWHDVSPETVALVLAAMGTDVEGDGEPPAGPTLFVGPGRRVHLDLHGPAELTTEDGTVLAVEGALPEDLPFGYHRLTALDDGRTTDVIVSPGRCPLPAAAPTWGWAVQLYAVRSASSWGMGDLGDLGRLARWAAQDLAAGLILVNPLHAAHPTLPQSASPYFPSSRRFRNPLYLRVEDVEGASSLDGLDRLAGAGRALNAERHIDRDAVYRLKMEALDRLWEGFRGDPEFDRWREEQGKALGDYAAFCVLAEEHGPDWRLWPANARHPDGADVAEVRRDRYGRWRFHQWLQWLVDRQLRAASADIDVIHDLAIGVNPAGADGWLWQDQLAPGMTVGAPPDEFSAQGQNWGLPPFDPWRLRSAGYGPFIETIRATLGHAGGLRLDHVMGLFRLWWVPEGASAADGAYIRYPSSDLLDIVALECHRAGAYAVGEDLGTVEDSVREELADRGVLSYRLVWFEEEPPSGYPEQALAAVTTHDLPTVAGVRTGADLENQKTIGMEPNEKASLALRTKLAELVGLDDDAPVDEVVRATYAALADAPSMLLTAGLDDALGVEERPNMPGTTDEWPNWSIALPLSLEEIEADPRPRAVAAALERRRSAPDH